MPDQLRDLVKQERFLRKTFDSVHTFLDQFDADTQVNQVGVRLQRLEEALEKLLDVRKNIELLTDDIDVPEAVAKETQEDHDIRVAALVNAKEKENEQIIDDIENDYCGLRAALLSLQSNYAVPVEPVRAPSTSVAPVLSRVKLPEIRLPSFCGQIEEWISFRDTFDSLIHKNPQLSAMDKFNYLRLSLTGEALQEISSVEMSAANYEVAWSALEKRYDNRKLIVKAHLDSLFAIEAMKRESYEGLNHLIGDFEKHLLMLDKVGEDTTKWSTVLVHMMCSRLDATTLRNWETHFNSKDVPSYDDLINFLRSHCSVLQSVAPSAKPGPAAEKHPRYGVSHSTVQSSNKCPFCSQPFHFAYRCMKFLKMAVPERYDVVRQSKLCLNCLSPGHQARFCSRGSCHHCHQRHHSLLHPNSSVPQAQNRPPAVRRQQPQIQVRQNQHHTPQLPSQNQNPPTHTAQLTTNAHNTAHSHTQPQLTTNQNTVALPTSMKTHSREVLISTALVRITDEHGNCRLARALLDSCSQYCFMRSHFMQRLKLRSSPEFLAVQGIGGSSTVSKKLVEAVVSPRLQQISQYCESMTFYVLPELTTIIPAQKINTEKWSFPEEFMLADPHFCDPGEIDIIIGAEHYFDLLTDGRTKLTIDGPTLQNTVFGWIVSGRVPMQSSIISRTSHSYSIVDVHDQLMKFWELETCRSCSTQSVEETACETIFDETTIRDQNGRFVVTLPKREFIINQLGETKLIAMRRFLNLEKRLQTNPELKAEYGKFIRDYHQLGHMREVPDDDGGYSPAYYMPHHAVLKPESSTTKLRVVFDASCKSSSGISLNDALMVGPTIQDDLISTSIRFRFHQVAIVADVEKMYRMVKVQNNDQRLQRILWRETPDEPVRTYELTTVTYGTASAPYLATKCLQRLADDEKVKHPRAAKVLQSDFYVDDMLTGTDNVEDGKHLAEGMISLLDSAGFTLRKWNSNSRELLSVIPTNLLDDRATVELDSSSAPVKTLGLLWEPNSDSFRFQSPTWNDSEVITKRTVLMAAAKLFDPDGLIGPVVVVAKMFMQLLWQHNFCWDEPLPEPLQNFWLEYRRNLSALDTLVVPRWLGYKGDLVAVEIHGFCDASEKAYGACLYLRCVSSDGSVEVNLIMAKSRVAPLEDLKRKKKKQTIPRLELSSALLLSHVYEKLIHSVELKVKHTATFYTDSTISLCWLSSLPSRWQMFVANRVSEIQHITKGSSWKHVSGIENPADIISRGMTPPQLQYQTLWFKGPTWLRQDRSTWPAEQPIGVVDRSLLEEKVVALPAVEMVPSEIFSLRSSFNDLLRLVAWLRRFMHNSLCKIRQERRIGFLSHTEYEEATLVLVRLSQQESFAAEIATLQKADQVEPSSRISMLNPVFLGGILRVGGRLANAPVSVNRKHPIILCHHHPLTKLILVHYHHRLYHAGLQLLVASVREKYWPTRVRRLANTVIHECVPCYRNKPTVSEQLMADLPASRVSPASPFLRVGVDYCGPFLVVYPGRRRTPIKYFVAVFVCLVTKAVHLELVGDLTTEAFLAAFKRFVARRGRPILVMCDNATNFVGARRQLDELRQLFRGQQFQESVAREAEDDGIEFSFIPARTPNFGGLWEAAVKSFKTHFKRTIGQRVLQHDEMQTVVTQIEAILNSRPLTPISNDPNDFEALTPGHFLVQRPLTAVPEPNLQDIQENRLSMWQRAQDCYQRIWKTWSTQYLSDLHNRTKWTRKRNNVAVDTMVLIKDDNLPPLKWQLGRVTEIHRGSDGNIRVVSVRTQYGTFRRGISKICVLPIRDNLAEGEQ